MSDKLYKIGTGIGVMIFNKKGQILLGHRTENSGSVFGLDDVWALPGGKVEYGETFEQAAAREIMEELGIRILKPEVKVLQTNMNEKAHFTTVGLAVTKFEGEPKIMEPEDHDRWEWFDMDDLPEIGYVPSREMIDKYKRGVFYEVIKDVGNEK
jgi:8-oxo-dGTP diphosphatase